jgi:hypothetical protein
MNMMRTSKFSVILLGTAFLLCLPFHVMSFTMVHHEHHTTSHADAHIFEHFHDMSSAAFTAMVSVAVVLLFFVTVLLEQVRQLTFVTIRASQDTNRCRTKRLRDWFRLHFTSPPLFV